MKLQEPQKTKDSVNEVDQVPHTVVIVAQRGPDLVIVWSPVGRTENVPIPVPKQHLSMPTDMAQ